MTPATDAAREARAREIAWKLVIGEKVGGGDGQTYVGRTPTVREIEAALLAFADTEAASQPREGDTVAFVQQWLMSSDHEPTKWDRDFAAAIDARVIAVTARRLAEAFCATPLPDDVCADLCATVQGPGRYGTHLLTVGQAEKVFAAALTQRPPEQAGAVPAVYDRTAKRIAELIAEGDGAWSPCSGCQEGVDGHVSEADYPYDPTFQCQPGGGCGECGGIGVVWHDRQYFASWEGFTPSDAAPTPPYTGPGEIPAGMVDATMLGEAMQDAWGEICDDAGSHPSDIKHGRGTVLFYSPGHWTDLIALRLSERLTSKAPPQSLPDALMSAMLTPEDAWQELVEFTDRTSPEEYPDMCLITRDELIDFMRRTLPTPPDAGSGSDGARGHADTEGEAMAMFAHLNCPLCTGSGHVEDAEALRGLIVTLLSALNDIELPDGSGDMGMPATVEDAAGDLAEAIQWDGGRLATQPGDGGRS